MIMVTWSRPRSVKEDVAHTACRSSQRKPRISLNISTIYSTSPSIFQQSFQWIQSSDSYFNNLPLGRKSRRALHSFPCDTLITIFFSVQYFLTLLGYRLLGQLFEINRKNSKCVSFFFVFFFPFHSNFIATKSKFSHRNSNVSFYWLKTILASNSWPFPYIAALIISTSGFDSFTRNSRDLSQPIWSNCPSYLPH